MTAETDSPASSLQEQERLEFVSQQSTGWQAALLLAGGIIGILLVIAVFLLLLLSPIHNPLMPGILGGMSVAPLFMIGMAIARLKAPIRVVLDAKGVLIERRIAPQFIPWADIAEVRRDRTSGTGWQKARDVITLHGEGGRLLARIVGTLSNFTVLVTEVEARSALARGTATYDRDRSIERRRRKARRNARFIMVTGLVFAMLGLFVTGQSLNETKHKRAIVREGVDVDATIVRHYRYNVTPHLEYTFEDAQGRTFRRDVMMRPSAWEELEGESMVSVRYLPSDPDWSVIEGEQSSTPEGPPIIAAGVLCTLMGTAFFVLGVLGIDIRTDGGKLKVTRIRDIGDELLPDSASSPVTNVRPAAPVRSAIPLVRPPAATPQPPRSYRILGGLNIAFGLLGTLVHAFRLWLASFLSGKRWTQGNMAFQFPEADNWIWVQHGVNLALAVVLLLSGIALLASWQPGRRLAITAAAGQILMGLIAFITAVYVASQGTDEFEAEARIGITVGFVGAMILELLGLVYPMVLLILLTRRPRGPIQPDPWTRAQP